MRVAFDAGLAEPLPGTRMHGEHYGHLLGNRIDSTEELSEFFGRIDV